MGLPTAQNVKYIYFITENEETSFFTTDFESWSLDGENYFEIFNFDKSRFNFDLLKYVAVDYTNSNGRYYDDTKMKYYSVELSSVDDIRNVVILKVIGEELNMDLIQYRREIRIEKMIEDLLN
jgi:hypothetical protein